MGNSKIDTITHIRTQLQSSKEAYTRKKKIINGYVVSTENCVTRVTVRHHGANRVRPNSYSEWRNFQIAPNIHYGLFFLYTLPSTIVTGFENALLYQING